MFRRNRPNLGESVSDQVNNVKEELRKRNPTGEIMVEIKKRPPRGVFLLLRFPYPPEGQKRDLIYTDGRLYSASTYGHSFSSLYQGIKSELEGCGIL